MLDPVEDLSSAKWASPAQFQTLLIFSTSRFASMLLQSHLEFSSKIMQDMISVCG